MPWNPEIIVGNIVDITAEAIVNAANNSLLGGGGVDGAIHRAAGPGLLEECRSLNGCRTGEAKITGAYNLTANYIIHTVGPVWQGGAQGEAALLASCYRYCIQIAQSRNIRSIAFPAISTGVYGYPPREAALIALTTVRDCLLNNEPAVKFVCFDKQIKQVYEESLGRMSIS